MGNAVHALRSLLGSDEREQQIAERLTFLEKMGKIQAESAMDKILRGTEGDLKPHGGTIVEQHTRVNILAYSGTDAPDMDGDPDKDQSSGKKTKTKQQGLKGTVNQFFSGEIVDGIESVLSIALDTFLGNTQAGESEESYYFLVWADNALLRVDWYCYRYNMSNKDIIQDVQSLVAYALVKRVLDWQKLDPQVVSYAITRYCDEDTEKAKREVEQAAYLIKTIKQAGKEVYDSD